MVYFLNQFKQEICLILKTKRKKIISACSIHLFNMNSNDKIRSQNILDNQVQSYFPAIDGMRALAVLAVILFHLEIPIFSGGFVGVDVFFVISGYLITRNIIFDLKFNKFSFSSFYLSRVRRLIPALLTTILLTLIVGVLLYSPDALIRVSSSAIAGVLSLANIRFWLSADYFDTFAASKPLLHLWSLSLEEQFYFLWPLLLFFVYRLTKSVVYLILVISIVFLVSLLFSQHFSLRESSTAFYLVQFRAFEFAIGALLAAYEDKESVPNTHPKTAFLECVFIIGLLGFLYALITFDRHTVFPGYAALLPCLSTGLLLVSKSSSLAKIILANSVARGIGKISYSLYLVHWPIWVYASFWYFTSFTEIQKALLFLFMILVGSLLFFIVEKRFRKFNTSKNEVIFYKGLVATALMVLLTAWYIRSNDGMPSRVEQFGANIEQSEFHCDYYNNKRQQECQLGKKSGASIKGLLIGDSHSMSLRPALHHLAQENNISIDSISYAGCPPLLGVGLINEKNTQIDKVCKSFSDRLGELLINYDYDFFIIAARWMWHFEHNDYHETIAPPKSYLIDNENSKLTADSSRLVWRKAIARTISNVRDTGRKVILFSQPPLMNKGIGECDKSPPYLINSRDNEQRCRSQIPYQKIMQRMRYTDETLLEFENNNVLVVNPSKSICDDTLRQCNILTEKGLLYKDADHLSQLGSEYVINSVKDKIIEFIK